MKYCRARTYTSHTNPLQLHLLHGVLIYFDCIFVCVCVCASKGRTALVFDRLPSSNGRLVRLCLCSTGMASNEKKKKKVFLIFRCWTELSRVYVTAALPPHT